MLSGSLYVHISLLRVIQTCVSECESHIALRYAAPTLKFFFKTLNFQIQKNKLRFAASSFGLDWIYLLSVCLSLGLEGLFVCIRLQWLGKREEVRVGDLSVCVH